MCFGVENKGHKLNKNGLPCLLDILPVFVCHILAISVRFQWVLGSLNIFLSLYGIYIYILLTKREGRTERISALGLDSTDRA